MKKFIIALILASAAAGATAQMPTRSIHVSGYNTVNVSATVDIIFDNRFSDSIYVDSSSELIDKLQIEIKGSKVDISYKKVGKGKINSNRKTVVYMSAAALTSLTASGGSDIVSYQRLEGKNINIKLSGESSLRAPIESSAASLKLSGNARFEGSLNSSSASFSLSGKSSVRILSGKCNKLSLSAGGESEFSGRGLSVTKYTKCSLSSSSKAELALSGDANISTTGSASLYGRLDCKKTSISMNKTCRIAVNGRCKSLVLKTSGKCDFKNPGFIADNSISCITSGESNVDLNCKGNVSVKASDACNINVQCTGSLKIAASGNSCITYTEGTKVASLSIKDQATSRAVKPSQQTIYNPVTAPVIR